MLIVRINFLIAPGTNSYLVYLSESAAFRSIGPERRPLACFARTVSVAVAIRFPDVHRSIAHCAVEFIAVAHNLEARVVAF
jgi:hypothetical protein